MGSPDEGRGEKDERLGNAAEEGGINWEEEDVSTGQPQFAGRKKKRGNPIDQSEKTESAYSSSN